MENWIRKSHTEWRAVEELKESVWSVVRPKIYVTNKGKMYRTVLRWVETWALKKAQEKKLAGGEIRMLR